MSLTVVAGAAVVVLVFVFAVAGCGCGGSDTGILVTVGDLLQFFDYTSKPT